jgi:hypothetical protein
MEFKDVIRNTVFAAKAKNAIARDTSGNKEWVHKLPRTAEAPNMSPNISFIGISFPP